MGKYIKIPFEEVKPKMKIYIAEGGNSYKVLSFAADSEGGSDVIVTRCNYHRIIVTFNKKQHSHFYLKQL